MSPVAIYFSDARARQKSPLLTRLELSDLLVIGIEQIAEQGMEFRVAHEIFLQEEGLEKPAHMRQVPLGRTGLGGCLDHVILG